ncbi:Asp-tRNA(Asn)/Glu-tRNA(Gln) amidotransferase subunit GatB [Patescibacteria group bacterium]|nr:MAG: Asp-tRNA(Asn)/Glu-tRNA(Gln) amidotransferase subunit GatB [Patescibacteria group bacterium]
MSKYEVVIGIETHVQLRTKTKLFCSCNNDARDEAPNKYVCPVCTGMPGALPVLNKRAVDLSLQAGHALNAYENTTEFHSKFDRKNYFYPDSPMNYQITQFDEPIVGKGYVEFPVNGETKRVGITRAHLEADAGKLTHPAGTDYSLVDLNRAGTPLLEIVSEPDMRSAAEAKAYAQELYNLMRYAGVSDANLYYGNMRFDVNVSLRPIGSKEFGTRTESKNLNSFRAVAGVVEYETKRQTELLDKGEKIIQETRGWDENKNVTFSQRSKEEAHDYRYFPEPDIPPLVVTEKMLGEAKGGFNIMPKDIREALAEAKIKSNEMEALIGDPEASRFWLQVVAENPAYAHFAFNWLIGDRIRLEDDKNESLAESAVDVTTLTGVAKLIDLGKISSTNAKILLERLWDIDEDPLVVADQNDLLQNSDTGELEKIVDEVIAANPGPWEQLKAGETKVLGFLVGQVMKASKGQANPPMVNDILKKKLGS